MRLSLAFCLATPAFADAPILQQPVDCTLGTTCYIQQYPDQDPGPNATDFRCGPQTYNTHKGTDFALPSLAAQRAGVAVLAAAPGTVTATRNDMPDIPQTMPGAPAVSGRECGNGLVIDHGRGWETQYCHLAQGSVTVTRGDVVATGDTLGMIGLSGQTEFPHLHLSVRQNGTPVDPFDPTDAPGCTVDPANDMWDPDLPTPAGGIITAGFADAIPSFDAIKAGTADQGNLTTQSPAFVLWVYIHGGRAGDEVTLSIGDIYSQTVILERTQAQLFRAGGRRTPPEGWPPGRYEGRVTLSRNGKVIAESQRVTRLTTP